MGPPREQVLWVDRTHGRKYVGDYYGSWGPQAVGRFGQQINVTRNFEPEVKVHFRWTLGPNNIKGMNNKIKVITRVAYGYGDEAHFSLKIRAAFPGVGQ